MPAALKRSVPLIRPPKIQLTVYLSLGRLSPSRPLSIARFRPNSVGVQSPQGALPVEHDSVHLPRTVSYSSPRASHCSFICWLVHRRVLFLYPGCHLSTRIMVVDLRFPLHFAW